MALVSVEQSGSLSLAHPISAAERMPRWWVETAIILMVCAIGLFVRVYGLHTIPPGLYNDEAAYAMDARAVVNGLRVVFFEANSGREPIFVYLLAAAFTLSGDNAYTVRLTAALIGAATIPATYAMVRAAALFAVSSRAGRTDNLTQQIAPWVAPWVSLALALSYWHISLSRLGFRAITLPLVLAVASGLLFRSLRRLGAQERLPWSDLVFAGFFMGLVLYTYTAGRFIPLFVVVALAFSVMAAPHLGLPRRKLMCAATVIVVIMLFTMLPLLVYFVGHSWFIIGHAFDVSVLNSQFADVNPLFALLQNAGKFILMFFTLPDPEVRHDPALRPVFDIVLSLWLGFGIVLGLINWRRLSLFYFVLWTFIFALPSMLSAISVPSSLSAISMMPGIFVLPVAAMLWAGTRIAPRHPKLAVLAPLPFVLVGGILGVRDYFSIFATTQRFHMPFLVAYVELGNAIRTYQNDALWIVPLSAQGMQMENRMESVRFVVDDPKRVESIPLDPARVSDALQSATAGVQRVNVMDLYGLSRFEVNSSFLDSKRILDFLLGRNSVEEQPHPGETNALATHRDDGQLSGWIPYETYFLKDSTDFSLPAQLRSTDIQFANNVQLTGLATAATGSTVDSQVLQVHTDQRLWAVLGWKALQDIDYILKTSLVLLDAGGHVVAQQDGMLAGDKYPAPRTWYAGEATRTYHLLQPLPGTPPGEYTLALSVYEDQSGRVYPASMAGGAASQRAHLGEVTLLPPLTAPQIAPQHALDGAILGSEIELAGFDLPRTTLSPGEMLGLTLYWQAVSAPTRDFTATADLVDDAGIVAASSTLAPGGSGFATSAWRPGFAVRDPRALLIDPRTPAGTYALRVRLLDGDTQVGVAQLGEVTVEGRSRLMTPPQIEQPLSATFGDNVRLLGASDMPAASLKPGTTLPLTFVWQAMRTADAQLVRSVQLLDAAGVLVAQQDGIPCAEECPSTSWLLDEYLLDAVTLDISPALAPGSYRIIVGWYDANSLQRLPAVDADGKPLADNMALLPTVVIGE